MSSAVVESLQEAIPPLVAIKKQDLTVKVSGKGVFGGPRAERPEDEKTVQSIYNLFKKMGGGADGGVVGFNGSIKARCLVAGFKALDIAGKHLIDFGAGDGRVLLSAIAAGACGATGYELPDNKGHKLLFDCVKQRCVINGKENALWEAKDIDKLAKIKEESVVFTFWVGMPAETQQKILELCAQASVPSLLVFRDSKWTKPADVVSELEAHFSQAQKRRYTYLHCDTISMDMMGSNEAKTAWVYERQEKLRNPFESEAKAAARAGRGAFSDASVKKRKSNERSSGGGGGGAEREGEGGGVCNGKGGGVGSGRK